MNNNRAVFFDVDGTITEDTIPWKQIHDYLKIDNLLDFSHINSVEEFYNWAKVEVNLWKGKPYSDLLKALVDPPIREGAIEGIPKIRSAGYDIILLSGGIDELVKQVANQVKADYYLSNTIHHEQGIITGDFDFNIGSKSVAIMNFAKNNQYDLDSCIAVGDGVHDIQMFKKVGFSIAINQAKPIVGENAHEVVLDNDFNKVVSIILNRSSISSVN